MRVDIYVPDDLAAQVDELRRRHDLNVSAVCQQALRHEVERRNADHGEVLRDMWGCLNPLS
jgi:predicted transcriptional regulator